MNSDSNHGSEGGEFSGANLMGKIQRFVPALKKWWWIPILIGTMAAAGMALHQSQQPPPTYVTSSQMWISGKIKLTEGGSGVYSEDLGNFFGTQMELMKSRTMISRAHARVQ